MLEPPKLTRVPGGQPGLAGVAAIRGAVVPVFDLAVLLGAAAPTRASRLVVIEHRGGVGLLVESAQAADSCAPDERLDLDGLFSSHVAGAAP